MMKRNARFRWLILLIPFLLGVYGYSIEYTDSLLGAMYSSLRLYSLNVDVQEEQVNIYIQLARWGAAAATTSVIVMLFHRFFVEMKLRWMLRNPGAVVVHGDGVRKDAVAGAMGNNAIVMAGRACFDAKRHILAFESDVTAVRYLREHDDRLLAHKDKEIYFVSYDYEPSDYAQSGLIILNHAVNCARAYWKEHWIKENEAKKIAIIGAGGYARRILEQALLVNVMAWREPLEYHVYGQSGERYLKWHPQLSQVLAIDRSDPHMDSIFFHPAVGEAGVEGLEPMDRIIIAEDVYEENFLHLNRFLAAGIHGKIHVRGNRKLLQQLQYLPVRQQVYDHISVTAFGDDAEMYTDEIILHGELGRSARLNHETYVRCSKAERIRTKYLSCAGCSRHGTCGDCLRADNTWDDLTPFEKASNIAAADHEVVKWYMLDQADSRGGLEAVKNDLCRTEHERWCRFYYLHNWKYGEVRNDAARRHPQLRPFDVLPVSEQEKDWWGYETLLSKEA